MHLVINQFRKFNFLGEKPQELFLLLFSFCMPLGQKLSSCIILIWFAYSLFFFHKEYEFWNKGYTLFLIFYFIYLFSYLYYDSNFSVLEKKTSFLVFPIIFFLNKKLDISSFKKSLDFFLLGCLIAIIYCNVIAFSNSFFLDNNSGDFKVITQVDSSLSFQESISKSNNYFFGNLFSVLHQTVYFSFFLNFAALIILFNASNNMYIKRKKIKIILFFFLSLSIFQLSSRAGILTEIVIIVFFILKKIKRRYLLWVLFTGMFFSFLVINLNPRMKILYENVVEKRSRFHPEDNDSYSLRLMTWGASLKVIAKEPFKIITGHGVKESYKKLKEVYRKNRYVTPYFESLNSHNIFFQLLIEVGLIGFFLFSLQLYFILKYNLGFDLSILSICFVFIILFNGCFESILNRYSGILFYSYFSCFFYTYGRNVINNNESKNTY